YILLIEENVLNIPAEEGVVQIFDEKKIAILIKGTDNMRELLKEYINKGKFFLYEKDKMYTKRESELLQKFLQIHKRMPKLNDEIEELF
ncbi:MAG: hypothetical protein AB1779_11745, partial [Candidatus Thermoplasmatota archaeon]